MEAVAANALLEQAPRKREQLGHPRLRAVETVIETGDLRQCRMQLGQRLDCRQIMRKVQRKERDELFNLGNGLVVQPRRAAVGRPAEHHPVSRCRHPDICGVRFDPADDLIDRLPVRDGTSHWRSPSISPAALLQTKRGSVRGLRPGLCRERRVRL